MSLTLRCLTPGQDQESINGSESSRKSTPASTEGSHHAAVLPDADSAPPEPDQDRGKHASSG
jgi:hypothetical protein